MKPVPFVERWKRAIIAAEQARKRERAAVVTFLREMSDGPGMGQLSAAADLIEAGAHRSNPA